MSALDAPRAAAGQPTLPEPAGPARQVLRWLCDPRPYASAPPTEDFSPLGPVLEGAIDAKLVCVLADRLLHGRHGVELTRAMRSFLIRLLRANARHTRFHRGEAVRIVQELTRQGIPVAVLNGLAYDTDLYPPGGLRQFTDIDLLVAPANREAVLRVLAELGFWERGRRAHTRRRPTEDTLVPVVSVDIATSLGHTAEAADVQAALARAHTADTPETQEQLPVLTRTDALRHALARLADRPRWTGVADAARLALTTGHISLPEQACTGWTMLRVCLPDLPLCPPDSRIDGPPSETEGSR